MDIKRKITLSRLATLYCLEEVKSSPSTELAKKIDAATSAIKVKNKISEEIKNTEFDFQEEDYEYMEGLITDKKLGEQFNNVDIVDFRDKIFDELWNAKEVNTNIEAVENNDIWAILGTDEYNNKYENITKEKLASNEMQNEIRRKTAAAIVYADNVRANQAKTVNQRASEVSNIL